MATAVLRNMTLGQNLHMLPNNCVIVSNSQTPVIMHHQGRRPIAPATEQRSNNTSSMMMQMEQNRCAKKMKGFTHMTPYGAQPASVQRRNARERNRVKLVNNGFANLRQHIPSDVITTLSSGGRGASKKLSKVDTLKLAVEYIRRLKDLLDENENDSSSTASSAHSSQNSSHSSSSYYSASPMQHSPMQMSIPQTCSETSASPTPSYASEISSGHNYVQAEPQYKYEVYDSFNPRDEELLDCITWWQQQ